MNEIMQCIKNRRSIRKYKPEQIKDQDLAMILEAGLYAPCAGSRQSAIVAVCQDEENNEALGKINKSFYHGRRSAENSYVSKSQPSIADNPDIISAFYGAPTVLYLFAPNNFLYGEADCCVMAQNMILTAYSLGIGSCMVMRAAETFESELGKKLQKQWDIDESYEAKVVVTLGYAVGEAISKPRKENRIRVWRQ